MNRDHAAALGPTTGTPVDRVVAPTRAEFERRWLRPGRPVVIEGAIDDWPARRLWSVDHLRRTYGERVIPVARTHEGGLLHDARTGLVYDHLRLDAYLDRRGGYAIVALETALPELTRDLGLPACSPEARWAMRKLWLSAADTRSPLHQDLTDNLYAQVVGRKRVTLFHPGDARHLYRHPLHSRLPNFSRVDAEAPDHARFPSFARARPLSVVLAPGELLYIPRWWWHQMRSLDLSMSVSYWWATGAAYWTVRAALLYKKLRALRY